MHVLLIEDDELVATGIRAGLESHGWAVDRVATMAAARHALHTLSSDIVVLDRGLQDGDGLSLVDEWRETGRTLPVLVLTAWDAVHDRVAGLKAGADDYLVKPFDLDELVARLHALLRRAGGRAHPLMMHGPLCFDPQARQVTWKGRPVALSRREMVLLETFLQSPGSVLSADQLRDSLYGLDDEVESNALNVHIHYLRRKLVPAVIETVRGLGYRLGTQDDLARSGASSVVRNES